MTKAKLLSKLTKQSKTIRVEAWDTDVTISQLNISEGMKVQSILFKNQTLKNISDGQVEVGLEALTESNILAVSLALTSPKLSVKELNNMGPIGLDGINEIKNALDTWDKPKKLEDGNSSSN